MKFFLVYTAVTCISYNLILCPLYAVNNETNNNSSQKVETGTKTIGPPQPAIPPQPAVPARPAVPSRVINSSNTDNSIGGSKKTHFVISEFNFPDNHELHIKMWKNGKESKEYYIFEKKVGIKVDNKIIRYPHVDAMCCIEYGKKGNLKPFVIDLNRRGGGETDLPGCKVEKSNSPQNSLRVKLPDTTPKFNM